MSIPQVPRFIRQGWVAIFLLSTGHGQDARPAAAPAPAAPSWPADRPPAPAILPGRGLAQHDFFYAGEAKTQDMYIVRHGRVVWSYHNPGSRGEISDAVLMSNGNVLFAHQYGVTEITPEKKIVWNYDAPPKTEVHTAQPIGRDRVLFIQNGAPARLLVVNIVTGRTEREFPLPVKNPDKTHGQFRHARLTAAGTLVVAHMDLGKAAEYDETGREIWSVPAPAGLWSAVRLPSGNTLLCGSRYAREVTPAGAVVWEFTPADVPDYKFSSMQLATRLPGGDTLIDSWVNQWNPAEAKGSPPVQVLELTPGKRIVWALRAWAEPANLGPATTIQLLDEPGAPEAVHFGGIE
jgi:outer membrane protein assembly factor BamB